MPESSRISSTMKPALDPGAAPNVGNISLIPAVRVQLRIEGNSTEIVATIDTGAGMSVLDRTIFDSAFGDLKSVQGADRRSLMLASGAPMQADIHELDLRLLGDEQNQFISLDSVPVAVVDLGRPIMMLGQRGVLEWLTLNVDYPHRVVNIQRILVEPDLYPSLASEFPSLASAIEMVDAGHETQSVMALVWDMEQFIYRLAQEDDGLLKSFKRLPRERRTLGSLLEVACRRRGAVDITEACSQFVQARNNAVHSANLKKFKIEKIFQAAETIVSELATESGESQNKRQDTNV